MDFNQSDRDRLKKSALFSLLFYAFIGLFFMLFPETLRPPKTVEYQSVKILLTPPEREIPPPAPQKIAEVQEPERVPAADKAVPSPAKKAPPAPAKSAPSKPAAAKAKPAEPARQSSGLGIPNFDKPVVSSSRDTGEAEFLDFTASEQSSPVERKSLPSGGLQDQVFEGSAGRVDSSPSGPVSAVSSTARQKTAASESTERSLKEIGAATAGSRDGSSSSASSASASDSRSVSTIPELSFEGAARRLLSPANPKIELPPELAALIDSNRDVTIGFLVRADGSVPEGRITFTPSASLPPKVQDFLRREFSRWRFEAGSSDGQEGFLYSIKIK